MVVCWILAGWLAAANVAGYLVVGYDKSAARRSHRANPPRRISENKLFGLAFFGGFAGMLAGFTRFRHKTRKKLFLALFFATALASTVVWAGWVTVLGCLGV